MKGLFFIILFITPGISYSQNCNCDSNFQWLKSYMERNYPGFKAKVNSQTSETYEANTKKYEILIKQANNPAYCEYYLLRWLSFFKDKHIQIQYDLGKDITDKDEVDTNVINQLNKHAETLNFDSIQFVRNLLKEKNRELEGLYISFDSVYIIAVIKNKNIYRDYSGIIISSKTRLWHNGEVKLEFKQLSDSTFDVIAYMRNHSFMIYDNPYKVLKNGNTVTPGWKRINPPLKEENENTGVKLTEDNSHNTYYRNLNDEVSYIRINSFEDFYANEIDSVIKANMNQISTHKFMILDLRNNGGGADMAYQPLLPILYSNPVEEIGVDIYSTPDNINAIHKMLREDKYISKDDIREQDSLMIVMNSHPYQFIMQDTNDTIKFNSIMQTPEKIVVLINRYCASTTEQFLLYAKSCKKVTLMGENTMGVLDYSNCRPTNFPCLPGIFYYPITRSRRVSTNQGIDGIGISPNIRLNANQDWVEYAQEYLMKGRKSVKLLYH